MGGDKRDRGDRSGKGGGGRSSGKDKGVRSKSAHNPKRPLGGERGRQPAWPVSPHLAPYLYQNSEYKRLESNPEHEGKHTSMKRQNVQA